MISPWGIPVGQGIFAVFQKFPKSNITAPGYDDWAILLFLKVFRISGPMQVHGGEWSRIYSLSEASVAQTLPDIWPRA